MRRDDTLLFEQPPVVGAWAAAGGKKESEGPLASAFDFLTQDAGFAEQGCENWEQAESLLQRRAVELCLRKADIPRSKVDIAFAGDLQAQCTASNYTMRELGIPFAGVYGACSTMAETLALAAVFAAAGMAERALALTSSHFCAAERQFRTPLEYGAKRTPTAQWTATAAGACLVRAHGIGVPVRSVTFGRVQDYAVYDINNMGAAMMPASRWPKRACRWTTTRTAAAFCMTRPGRMCRLAAAGLGAAPPCCAVRFCQCWRRGSCAGCCLWPLAP